MLSVTQAMPTQWEARIGVHAGAVVAGVVGRRQYLFDLWGDTVNTAFRVESHGAGGAVNVSESAWERVAEYCHGESLGPVQVKGKGTMELYRISGLRA
jgi:class 3 adenylate cyclase